MSPVLVNPSRFLPSGSPFAAAVLATSPAVYYRLGDASGTTMTDSSGNARNGTYNNSPTLGAAGITSDGDKAVTFNGSTQDGSIAYASWMAATSATYMAAVKGTGTSQVFFGRGSSTTVGYIGIDATGKAFFQSRRSNSTNPNATSTSSINDGAWHLVFGVADAQTLRIYVGATQENSNATGLGINTTDTTNGLRVASRGGSTFLNGSVDECAFWPLALTGTQIASIVAAL